jgi:hypothetical protein
LKPSSFIVYALSPLSYEFFLVKQIILFSIDMMQIFGKSAQVVQISIQLIKQAHAKNRETCVSVTEAHAENKEPQNIRECKPHVSTNQRKFQCLRVNGIELILQFVIFNNRIEVCLLQLLRRRYLDHRPPCQPPRTSRYHREHRRVHDSPSTTE